MKLRNYFAGQALTGILSAMSDTSKTRLSTLDRQQECKPSIVKLSYEYADAMLDANQVEESMEETMERMTVKPGDPEYDGSYKKKKAYTGTWEEIKSQASAHESS